MKLRLLNGTHQAVGYAGLLANYTHVHEAVADQEIFDFLKKFMTADALPTLNIPANFDVHAYIDSLLDRFANPHIADLLSRMAEDSSSRIPKFVLPVILDALANGTSTTHATRVLADWIRYVELACTTDRFPVQDKQEDILRDAVRDASAGRIQGQGMNTTMFLKAIPQFVDLLNYRDVLTDLLSRYSQGKTV